MSARCDVLVLGSANVDLSLPVAALPKPGHTVLATGPVVRAAGGKGLNQAVAAARFGASVGFTGAIGSDADGDLLRTTLTEAGIDVSCVRVVPEPTGLAVVTVAEGGENCIVVVPGANATLTSPGPVGHVRVLLGQLETPISGFIAGARAARSSGARVILNAAPAAVLPDEVWPLVDVLVVNEHEAAAITSGSGELLSLVPEVVVTLGSAGSRYLSRDDDPVQVAPIAVRVMDTTAAGDTFCGVLAGAVAAGSAVPEAMRYAAAAASLCVQRRGAVASIPYRADIEAALSD